MYTVELPGPPSTLQLFYNDGGEHGDEVLYGTTDGKIGLVQLTRSENISERLLKAESRNNFSGKGAIRSG